MLLGQRLKSVANLLWRIEVCIFRQSRCYHGKHTLVSMPVAWFLLHVVRDVILDCNRHQDSEDCIADSALLNCTVPTTICAPCISLCTSTSVPTSARCIECWHWPIFYKNCRYNNSDSIAHSKLLNMKE